MNEAWYKAPEGLGLVRYEGDRILEIELPRVRKNMRSNGAAPPAVAELTTELTAYFAGANNRVRLPKGLRLDWQGVNGFTKRVYDVVAQIPSGDTWSYGEVAAAAGKPGAARAVGRAMATNPFPIFVPCHRVVRSDGSLGGFGGGLAMKERMLGFERGRA
ncbi:MAG: methylated-DNA--[protein]-cysteine S-methyltransferase [Actinomycetota bacterium]|nr:methylated-DNA--[protein]-cysteine S-methyltransferase [Actinomycetota bacterium]